MPVTGQACRQGGRPGQCLTSIDSSAFRFVTSAPVRRVDGTVLSRAHQDKSIQRAIDLVD